MKILVVEVGALHLGFVGCYGNDWIATPHLDRLAAEGIVFDRHYLERPRLAGEAARIDTELPIAHVSIPAQPQFSVAAIEFLRSATADICWIAGPDLTPPWELPEDLLDVYFDEEEDAEPWSDPPCAVVGPVETSELLELHNTYAAAVTWFDAQLGAILDYLRDAEVDDETAICVTASAGLALGEHGVIGPVRAWLHEELVHVPLIFRLPGGAGAGSRIDDLTQAADLLPTFAALLGQSPPSTGGFNLLPLMQGQGSALRPYAVSELAVGDSVEWSLRTPEWALLVPIRVPEGDAPRGPQLYIKPDDRWEVNDVRPHHLEVAEELERTLRTCMGGRG